MRRRLASILRTAPLLLLCIGALGIFTSSASAASSATFNVTTTADDASAPDPGNCPGSACSLRDAILAVEARTDSDPNTSGAASDVINVPAGEYVLDGDLPVITHNVRIAATDAGGAKNTIVNGTNAGGDSVSRVFEIGSVNPLPAPPSQQQPELSSGAPPTVDIVGLRITGGQAEYSDGGAGIRVDENTNSDNNTIPGPTLNLADSQVSGNLAKYAYFGGGGLLAEPGTTANLTRDAIVDNVAVSYAAGGGIYNAGAMSIVDTTIAENSTNCSPGYSHCFTLFGLGLGPNGGPGGGILNDTDYADGLKLVNNTIANNVGNGEGGGLASEGTGLIVVCIPICIPGSSQTWHDQAIARRDPDVRKTAFTNQNGERRIPVTTKNTVFSRNSVLGFFNSPSEANYMDCYSTGGPMITDLGNNSDYDQANSCGFNSAEKNDLVSTDPGLPTTLKLNGGTTPNYTPPAGSPVVDAANNDACGPDQTGPSDQTGKARISGPSCDIGAVEYQVPPTVAQSPPAVVTPGVVNAPGCTSQLPRSSISRPAFLLTRSSLRLIGRTVDFRCAGLNLPGTVKKVQISVAYRTHGKCRFLSGSGTLGRARSCSRRALVTAKLGQLRDGKVPWTFVRHNLTLPAGTYVVDAFAVDAKNGRETRIRRFNEYKAILR